MKELLEAGLLQGDCLTVTGKTVAKNLRDTPRISELSNQATIVHSVCNMHDSVKIYYTSNKQSEWFSLRG